MKKTIALSLAALAVVGALGLTACGRGANQSSSNSSDSGNSQSISGSGGNGSDAVPTTVTDPAQLDGTLSNSDTTLGGIDSDLAAATASDDSDN
jgi:hypothetical protein